MSEKCEHCNGRGFCFNSQGHMFLCNCQKREGGMTRVVAVKDILRILNAHDGLVAACTAMTAFALSVATAELELPSDLREVASEVAALGTSALTKAKVLLEAETGKDVR